MLRVRSADKEDSRLLWEWANDPDVRFWSFQSEGIPWEKHVAWFDKKMSDPNCQMCVVTEENGDPVGQVRVEVQTDGTALVSISIARDKRGRGYGAEALRLALGHLMRDPRHREMIAYVKPDNVASIRVFEKVGFVNRGELRVKEQRALKFSLSDGQSESSKSGTGI